MIPNQVDCIVRFHNLSRLFELNRCIFSLVGQTYRPLHIILATQRFSVSDIEKTRESLGSLLSLPNAPNLTITNWETPFPKDARSELLNVGLAAATGRYLAFLDYDDVLYPEAYEILIGRLRESSAAIAFGSVRIVYANVYRKFMHATRENRNPFCGRDLRDLFRSNFCPIHSYLIDRSVVAPNILSFDTSMTWEEDYDFLLKICAQYPSDFASRGNVIGDYYYKNDGSNSVPVNGHLSDVRTLEYERVKDCIELRRRTTVVSPVVQRQLGLDGPANSMTIRSLLDMLDAPYSPDVIGLAYEEAHNLCATQ